MKKLVNRPSDVVQEMLEGIARQSPHVAILGDEHVLVRQPLPARAASPSSRRRQRPPHGGYVGEGMLSAAVCGEVFTSPSTDAVLAAIRASAGPNGALLIVKNYTGDRLNFGPPPNSRAPKAFRSRRSSSPTTCRCAAASSVASDAGSPAPC